MGNTDKDFLQFYGGFECNSLGHVLQLDEEGYDNNEIQVFKHSPYYDEESLHDLLKSKKGQFCILSTNIESIFAKFDELKLFVEVLNDMNFSFSAICIQEAWLGENDDTSCIQLQNYECIYQEKSCSNKGGLIIYLHNKYKHHIHQSINKSTVWEGQFIEIYGDSLTKNVILGNIYRPPRDLIDNYSVYT